MPSKELIVELIMSIETAADRAAIPDSEAKPTAEPIAKSNGKLSNTTPPACIINGMPNLSPNASNKPAAGSKEIGNISARPMSDS